MPSGSRGTCSGGGERLDGGHGLPSCGEAVVCAVRAGIDEGAQGQIPGGPMDMGDDGGGDATGPVDIYPGWGAWNATAGGGECFLVDSC